MGGCQWAGLNIIRTVHGRRRRAAVWQGQMGWPAWEKTDSQRVQPIPLYPSRCPTVAILFFPPWLKKMLINDRSVNMKTQLIYDIIAEGDVDLACIIKT